MASKVDRLIEKMKVKDFKLKSMLEITKAINAEATTEKLLGLFKQAAVEELGIDKLLLFSFDESWKCILKIGVTDEIYDVKDQSLFHATDSISLSTGTGTQESFDIVIPVHHNNMPIAYLLVGDLAEEELKISPAIKHMNYIQTLTNIIIVAIRNKSLALENIAQQMVKKELELAAELQQLLVPNKIESTDELDAASFYKPHAQLGGDYYDFVTLADGRKMFCIADVSGKGVSAAFLMSNFQAHLRAIFSYTNQQLKDVVRDLNKKVNSSAMGEKYITMFIGLWNNKTRELVYINCGHNPPLLENGTENIIELTDGSLGLGMLEEIPSISEGSVFIKPNSRLVCFTDGLVEIENDQMQEFGIERVMEILEKNPTASSEQINSRLITAVNNHRGEMPFMDDTAILTLRFT
ncbi:MAG: PP2C family protein-serine/threonine phosphatase [Flavobacteriales bacterium]|jgi:sigma-B regulation protein RsbU (phosphoserine phosphatase)|tara:strand:+ start:4905 stop:6131 length:1227 start_codon:yes stop_codon:yes gene_type:complete